MQYILPAVELNDYQDISIDDLYVIMKKVEEINDWDNTPLAVIPEVWEGIEAILMRLLSTKNDVPDEFFVYTLGVIFPILCEIEEFYNAYAPDFTPDETEKQHENRLILKYILEIYARITLLFENDWDFQENMKKKELFIHMHEKLDDYLTLLENQKEYEVPEHIITGFDAMNELVCSEFNLFLENCD